MENEDLDDVKMEGNDVDDDDDDLYKPDEKPEVPLHVKYSTEVHRMKYDLTILGIKEYISDRVNEGINE